MTPGEPLETRCAGATAAFLAAMRAAGNPGAQTMTLPKRSRPSPSAAAGRMRCMESEARVCPFCGEPPGDGVFCAACGRNLAGVERLPTRAEWERAGVRPPTRAPADDDADVAAFLAAMQAAGNPGTQTFPTPKPSAFRRAGKVEGWVLRPVDREDFQEPKHYHPGLVLTVDGNFHRLDTELRGWGQREFPYYQPHLSLDPIPMPVDERLVGALAALRDKHGA